MSSVAGGLCSTTVQVKPLSLTQVAEQPSPEVVLPSSQSSCGNFRPSPQIAVHVPLAHLGSREQVGEQPSYGIRFPSSHCSKPSRVLLPQMVAAQTVLPLTWLH